MNIIKFGRSIVRIIDGSDDRGSDNRGSPVLHLENHVLHLENHVSKITFKSDWLDTNGCYDIKCLDTV